MVGTLLIDFVTDETKDMDHILGRYLNIVAVSYQPYNPNLKLFLADLYNICIIHLDSIYVMKLRKSGNMPMSLNQQISRQID
jgi:hypothetical protein